MLRYPHIFQQGENSEFCVGSAIEEIIEEGNSLEHGKTNSITVFSSGLWFPSCYIEKTKNNIF